MLVDTGAHPDTVLQNVRDLKIDLSDVKEVVLTHNHWDHTTGLLTLRRELMKKNPAALSIAHVGRGIFWSRPSPAGEDNPMIAIRKQYEATGGKFVEHDGAVEMFPGAWLSGPVPRKFPERNWSVSSKVETEGPTRVGTRATDVRRVPGGPRPVTYEVTEHNPPRKASFRGVSGPVRPVGTMTVEPSGNGSRVTIQLELVGHGLGKLMAPFAMMQARKQVPQDQLKLKQRLESGT